MWLSSALTSIRATALSLQTVPALIDGAGDSGRVESGDELEFCRRGRRRGSPGR